MQIECVGLILNGDVVVIEGCGYFDMGEIMFNVFVVVLLIGEDGVWEMCSYVNGCVGMFLFELIEFGYVWKLLVGLNVYMIYIVIFDGDSWSQIGEYILVGGMLMKIFEMLLMCVGEIMWLVGNFVFLVVE